MRFPELVGLKVAMVYPEVYDLARFNERRKEFPPFGVMYLSSMMESCGVHVEVFSISAEYTKLDLRGFDAVGYSIPSSATFGITKTSRFDSMFSPDTLVMAGGVHPNLYPEQTLNELKPDVVGIGECEITILEILKQRVTKLFSGLLGVCYRGPNGPVRTPMRPIERDIDWLPLPARHLLPLSDIIMSNRLSNTNYKMAHVMFTRGCPFPCRFCAVSQSKIQFRSGKSARNELIHLKDVYGIEGFAIVDDNFVVNKSKVYDVVREISDLNLKWSALSRVDTVDRNLLNEMLKSGCIEIKFGMESGSLDILQAMKKNITPSQISETVNLAACLGIKVKLFLVHGYPGENLSTTRESIRLLESMSGSIERVSLFRFAPLPGTYVYNNPKEFNLRGTDKNPDWDGNWDKYHIYHNSYHWWGTDEQFAELNSSFNEIRTFVNKNWPETEFVVGEDKSVLGTKS